MQFSRLQSLPEHGIAIDTETWLIQPGHIVPRLVCGSVGWLEPGPRIVGSLLDPQQTLEVFAQAAEDENIVLSGANIAFDLAVLARAFAERGVDVMPEIFRMFEQGRIYDLQIAEALNAIANGELGKDPRTGGILKNPETGKPGSYSLSMCVDLVLGRTDAKANDEWRLRYAELDGIPLEDWPQNAKDYPIDDVRNTWEVTLAQTGHYAKVSPHHNWITNTDGSTSCADCGTSRLGTPCLVRRQHRNLYEVAGQTYAAFALHLGAAWGFHVDQSYVDVIERHAHKKREKGIPPFIEAGIIRSDGSEDRSVLKRLIAVAYGATESCPTCQGTGKIPDPEQPTLRCPACKGRCQPWKSGGQIKEPTVASCEPCANTGRVNHHNVKMISCISPYEEKTCDGSGFLLTEHTPRAEKEGIAIGRDALHESGDDFLMAYGDFGEDAKVLKDYIPYLRETRTDHGDVALTLSPRTPLETGRVSYRGYIQLFPRAPGYIDKETGKYIPSLRECIVPRPGFVFSSEDFRAGELVTHAQSCKWIVGHSDLGAALLKGIDPHSAGAATMLGVTYEEFLAHKKEPRFKGARQGFKVQNFGRPGGSSSPTIVLQYRKQGDDTPCPNGPNLIEDDDGNLVSGYKGTRFCILMDGAERCGEKMVMSWGNSDRKFAPACAHCIQCVDYLGQIWKQQWPENDEYFKYIKLCVNKGQTITAKILNRWPWAREWFHENQQLNPGEIVQHVTLRIRGGLNYTAMANTLFQGLLADISKHAYRLAVKECYDRTFRIPEFLFENSLRSQYAGSESPLYGSRIPGFFHDELLGEHPESVAHDGATRISEIMRDVMRWYCPDYADAAEAEPTLMPRWIKNASMIKHNGRLVPWTREHDEKTCAECQAERARTA